MSFYHVLFYIVFHIFTGWRQIVLKNYVSELTVEADIDYSEYLSRCLSFWWNGDGGEDMLAVVGDGHLICFGLHIDLLVAWAGGLIGWLLLMSLARQWLLSTNPCVSGSVCSGHGQGILDGCLLCAVWWGRWGHISHVLPVIEYHWIVAFHSCHLPFQTPGIMNRCPTKRYLICIFKLLNCLLDFSRRFIITKRHTKTVGIWGKTCSSLYSTWRDCNSELPGGVHKTNLCHHPPSWFNNVHKSWFFENIFQWFHCDRIRWLHSDLFF